MEQLIRVNELIDRNRSTVQSDSRSGFNCMSLSILVLLIPFFEPLCFSYLKDCAGFEAIGGFFDTFFMAYRICAVFAICVFYSTRIRFGLYLLVIVLMGFFSCLSVAIMNTPAVVKALYEAVSFVALGMFLFYHWKHNPDELVTACTSLFVVFSLLSLASIWLTEAKGIASSQFSSRAASDAIFFFGGKNSIFAYNLPTVLFLGLFRFRKTGRIGLAPAAVAILFCFASIQIDSASSTFFFLLVTLFCIALAFSNKCFAAKIMSQPLVLLTVFLSILLFIVLMGGQSGVVTTLLEMFGRSSTFSGRTGIWRQAIADVIENPFFGGGGTLMFAIGTTTTSHAHSFYLNALAQYGAGYFIVFIFDLVMISMVALRNGAGGATYAPEKLCVFLFYMLTIHSLFDYLSLPLYFLLRSCVLDGKVFCECIKTRGEGL